MAFLSASLPSIALDAWPSVSQAASLPWQTVSSMRSQRRAAASAKDERYPSRRSGNSVMSAEAKIENSTAGSRQIARVPEFLRDAAVRNALLPSVKGAVAPIPVQTSVSSLSRAALYGANPTLRRPFFKPLNTSLSAFARPFSQSALQISRSKLLTTRRTTGLDHQDMWKSVPRRNFNSVAGITRNLLASAEELANRNPGNAGQQNTFYQLLLRANMPGILIERYQSGRFATNAATDEAYRKALAALNMGSGSTSGAAFAGAADASNGSLAQGLGNAIAASSGGRGGNPRGQKGEPIHVVVEESMRSNIFRWIRFLAIFLVTTYICFALVTILIETLTSFRRGAGSQKDAEVKAEKQNTRFNDVHGCDEAKEELQEVVEFLKNPEKFTDLGAKLPKGVLLVGPPGTGKTLLARAVAGEAGVPFFYMSGSEFDEIFVGVGAKRVRDLFTAAKQKSPAIIFIDELDAIGGTRNPRDQAHAKQTLNQLLTELDGFDQDTRIIIMGATNLPKLLDKALTRPGRFDRHVHVDLPDYRGRVAILKHHAHKIKAAPDVDLEAIAARTVGRSGAELENLINVAALRASRAKANVVSRSDMEWAYDRLTLGSERKSMVVSEKEKEMTAYHEAGHALVQLFDKENAKQLYKVTILPKGPSLGHTAQLPPADKYSHTAAEYMSDIRVCLGGKMAEEMRYGLDKVTSGVSSDLERATDLSFLMVTNFGMSSVLGPVEYNRRYENLSSETRSVIETEVQKTLKKSYEDVRQLLTDKRKELDLLALALVKYETLDLEEVKKVIKGESLPGKPEMPPGPIALPVTDDAPQPPGLGGVPQATPPDNTPAPPVAA